MFKTIKNNTLIKSLILVLIVLFVVMSLFIGLFAINSTALSKDTAYAEGNTLQWSPSIKYLRSGGVESNYADYLTIRNNFPVTDPMNGIYIFIDSGFSSASQENFYYYYSDEALDNSQLLGLPNGEWTKVTNNEITAPQGFKLVGLNNFNSLGIDPSTTIAYVDSLGQTSVNELPYTSYDYIGFYVYHNSEYVLITESNYSNEGLIPNPGSTKAYTHDDVTYDETTIEHKAYDYIGYYVATSNATYYYSKDGHNTEGIVNISKYCYFMRTYTENSTLQKEFARESIKVIVNNTNFEPGIHNVKATYLSGSSRVEYNGVWISGELQFTITTTYMNDNHENFNTSLEKLYYSVDGGITWTPISGNVVTIKNIPLNDATIKFKECNLDKTKTSEIYNYNHVNVDPSQPQFSINAITRDASGTDITYNSGAWACNNVTFTINNTSNCISNISYTYQINNGDEMALNGLTYIQRYSINSISFTAENEAGIKYKYTSSYAVKIDTTTPNVNVMASTPDPDESSVDKTLTGSYDSEKNLFDYGYANDEITIRLYNRDSYGNILENTSPLTYYYQSRTGAGTYSNTWTKISTSGTSAGETYYYLIDKVSSQSFSVEKYYKFYIASGAGLASSEVEIKFTIVEGTFLIELSDISSGTITGGWISDYALVTTVVPTDSVLVSGEYTTPKLKYTFFFEATDGSFSLASAEGEPVAFSKEDGGIVYWTYTFKLVASANSTFNIFATNAAGKKSSNIITTPSPIQIDVIEPTYELTAYIEPTISTYDNYLYLDVDNPGWVNGSIVLNLKAKDGVSGIHVVEVVKATDSSGNVLINTSGEIVWKENDRILEYDSMIIEEDATYYTYLIRIYKENSMVDMISEEYRYRIYTGSGIYKEISFTANIDTTTSVKLDSATFTSGNKVQDVEVLSATSIIDLDDYAYYVCEDTAITFGSSLDKPEFSNHFDVYYSLIPENIAVAQSDLIAYASTLVDYRSLYDNNLTLDLAINDNEKGSYYVAVYIKSLSKDYKGDTTQSGYYVFKLSYNTLDLVIGYEIEVYDKNGNDISDAMAANEWVSGTLTISTYIYINTKGDTKVDNTYTFYYMLIDESIMDKSAYIRNTGRWIAISGDANDEYFTFTLNFANDSFYGRLALSVCNEAGFRNSQEANAAIVIRIDNTIPDIADAIVYADIDYATKVDGINEKVMGKDFNTEDIYDGLSFTWHRYYSTAEIYLENAIDTSRSDITYYYYEIDDLTTLITQDGYSLGLFTAINKGGRYAVFAGSGHTLTDNQYFVVNYAIYAVNAVGTENQDIAYVSGVDTLRIISIYTFIYDSSSLTGSLNCNPDDTNYLNTGMSAFLFPAGERITISVSASSSLGNTVSGSSANSEDNKYVKFQFTVDNGEHWYDYLEDDIIGWYNSGEDVELYFSQTLLGVYEDVYGNHPFENGVKETFKFRAVNKSGTFLELDSVFIAIDETTPEFELIAIDSNNVTYIGGNTSSISDMSAADWRNGPISVTINVTRWPASGIKFYYHLEYMKDTSLIMTSEKEIKSTTYTFTTDNLDGFNMNMDAVLYVRAVSNSGNAASSTQSIRLSVDQVVPTFTLSGLASDEKSSVTEVLKSGDWTSKTTVAISKSVTSVNVSNVVYTYTYKDNNSTTVSEYTWSDEEGTIVKTTSCVLTITATSAAGLTYTQVFEINIDTTPPVIKFQTINVIEGEKYYIDLKVYVEEANINICEYITIKGDTRGFAFDPTGYILSTSSVDNSVRYDASGNEYSGYVKIYVEDYAGNTAEFVLNVLPFALTVSNITLSDEDLAQVDEYASMLEQSISYIDSSRYEYFANLISRLRDRINTLENEITTFQDYLEKIANRNSFELKSDYAEMFSYMKTFNDYEIYGQKWIQDAITGDSTSKYYAYYQNFLTQFSKLQALMNQVELVEADVTALPAINMVEAEDYQDILTVYDEYYDLTLDQRACFDANLYNKLMDLKKQCEVLLLADSKTGVSINGDFAPGATISVTSYAQTSDTHKNAQAMLASTIEANKPRTIVSIYRVALDGAYAQTSASDISVELPISSEYQSYKYFAVYELSDDGSLTLVENVTVNADGESVSFSTPKLATYVLAVQADMQATDTSENVYGSILGLELDVKMIRYLIYGGIALFGIVILVVILMAIRHRRFLNSYNKAYRNSIYRRGVKGIPKGNKGR